MSEPMGVPLDASVSFRVIVLDRVEFDLTQSSPRLCFVEAEAPHRQFFVPVGIAEGQGIARALAQVRQARPGTAELMTLVLQELRADIIAVRIVRFDGGVFFAELDIMAPTGRRVFDCRPSDAVALALHHPSAAPFLIDVAVLEQVASA